MQDSDTVDMPGGCRGAGSSGIRILGTRCDTSENMLVNYTGSLVEMRATQASKPEAGGSDNEPRVADADENDEAEVFIGRVRNFEFENNKQRKKKARMRMLGKPLLESRPRSSARIRRAAAGWLSSLPMYSTKVSPKRVPAGDLVTRSYLLERCIRHQVSEDRTFSPAQHQRMYNNHVFMVSYIMSGCHELKQEMGRKVFAYKGLSIF